MFKQHISFSDFSPDFRKNLPEKELTEEERQQRQANASSGVKVDYSISKLIRNLKMDRQSDVDDRRSRESRDRRDSGRGSKVLLVERHTDDDDLRDHVEPNPEDEAFQMQRLEFGELTKDEKKRWKRRYKGEAVFMLPKDDAEILRRNYSRGGGRDLKIDGKNRQQLKSHYCIFCSTSGHSSRYCGCMEYTF